MKSLLSLLVFTAAVSQVFYIHEIFRSAQRNLMSPTIFYETLCFDCVHLFKKQVFPTFQDAVIRDKVHFELVPFGKAKYTEKPWSVTCEHGMAECLGNVMNACFMAKNPDNNKQVAFVSCCMSELNPAYAGEDCAKKLGYSYKGVKECMEGKEGIALQSKRGKRTLNFKPKINVVPTVIYNNVYNEKGHKDSKGVINRKLKAKGINV